MPTLVGSAPPTAEDVTQLIEECAATLTVQEPFLSNPHTFSLHDSMAATQLTDKKMDCCEIPASNYVETSGESSDHNQVVFPRPPPTGLSDAFVDLPWDELTVQDTALIGIQTLVRLQAFLSGCSVGESTATCLYAHRAVLLDMKQQLFSVEAGSEATTFKQVAEAIPNFFPKLLVYIFAQSLVETTEIARTIIVNADVYEEEDAMFNNYDATLLFSEAPSVSAMLLPEALKMAKAHIEDGDDHKTIVLVATFYFAFLSMAQSLESDKTNMSYVQSMAKATSLTLGELAKLATPHDKSEVMQRLTRRTCDSFVSRPLVGNAPIRRPNFQLPSMAMHILQKLTHELDWSLCDLMVHGTSFAKIQRVLDRVQQSNVNIYVRSLIVMNLFFDEKILGLYDLKQLIINYMRQWSSIPDDFFNGGHAQTFLAHLGKPLYDTLKLRLLNRCRQRTYIEAVLIPDWLVLQTEAHFVDIHYRREKGMEANAPPYFSQFVLIIILRLMDRYLAVGLEMGLFTGFQDLATVYWYRDYILTALLNNLLVMRRTKIQTDPPPLPQQPTSKTSSSKANGKKKTKSKPKVTAQQQKQMMDERDDDFEVLLLTLKRDLCRGMKRLFACLQQAQILRSIQYEFTSPHRIFEERFGIFQTIQQPPPLQYDDFVAGSDFSQVSQDDLLNTTSACFQSCKVSTDQLLTELSLNNNSALFAITSPLQESEIRNLQKVCVGNSVYLLKLRSIIASKSESSIRATFDFDGTNQFCIVKLS